MQAVFAGVDHAERPMSSGDDAKRRREIAQVRIELAKLERDLEQNEPVATAIWPAHIREGRRRDCNPTATSNASNLFMRNLCESTITATFDGTQPCIDELEILRPRRPKRKSRAGESRARSHRRRRNIRTTEIHKIEHLNDGKYGNARSWISAENGKGWVPNRTAQGRERSIVSSGAATAKADSRIAWRRNTRSKFRSMAKHGSRSPVPGIASAGVRRRRSWTACGKRLQELEKTPMAYCGGFRNPDKTFLLKRGDPMQKLDEVTPTVVASVKPRVRAKAGRSRAAASPGASPIGLPIPKIRCPLA